MYLLSGKYLQLRFNDFLLQDSYRCSADYLTIKENSQNGSLVATLCGSALPVPITSVTSLWLNLHSNWLFEKRGFNISYEMKGKKIQFWFVSGVAQGQFLVFFLGIVDLCGLFCRHTTSRSSEVKQEITSNHLARVRYVWFIFIVVCLLILWLLCDSRVTFMCFLCDFYVTLMWASCDFPLITFLYEYLCRITTLPCFTLLCSSRWTCFDTWIR